MTRLGTCAHTFEVQELFEVKADAQPHERKGRRVLDRVMYLCAWMGGIGPLPPPVSRAIGGGVPLGPGDCDACPLFKPVRLRPGREVI